MKYITLKQPIYKIKDTESAIIVPVVMMTEGVRKGSSGSILHLAEHYMQNYYDWNGLPVTAYHPSIDNQFVPVGDIDLDKWVVGELHDVHVKEGKLKANAHIYKDKATAINPEIINYILENKELEVSIGAFTEDDGVQGVYKEVPYQSVTKTYNPDHLALLPGEKGACSWDDGCGIRVNAIQNNKKTSIMEEKEVIKYLKDNWDIQVNGLSELKDKPVKREEALEVLSEDLKDLEKAKSLLSADVVERIEIGLTSYSERKEEYIGTIQANTEEFTKEKLGTFDMCTLKSLSKAVAKPVAETQTDYSVNGIVVNGADEGEMLLPPGVELSKN